MARFGVGAVELNRAAASAAERYNRLDVARQHDAAVSGELVAGKRRSRAVGILLSRPTRLKVGSPPGRS
jgi:hypothetical protein